MINAASNADRPDTFEQTMHKNGAWYTSANTGAKARGRAAAEALFAQEQETLQPANNSDDIEVYNVGERHDRLSIPVGQRYYIHGSVTTATGKLFKNDQPVVNLECERCGDIHTLHVQDVPQAEGICHTCTLDGRRERRNAARRERRAEAKAAAEAEAEAAE